MVVHNSEKAFQYFKIYASKIESETVKINHKWKSEVCKKRPSDSHF